MTFFVQIFKTLTLCGVLICSPALLSQEPSSDKSLEGLITSHLDLIAKKEVAIAYALENKRPQANFFGKWTHVVDLKKDVIAHYNDIYSFRSELSYNNTKNPMPYPKVFEYNYLIDIVEDLKIMGRGLSADLEDKASDDLRRRPRMAWNNKAINNNKKIYKRRIAEVNKLIDILELDTQSEALKYKLEKAKHSVNKLIFTDFNNQVSVLTPIESLILLNLNLKFDIIDTELPFLSRKHRLRTHYQHIAKSSLRWRFKNILTRQLSLKVENQFQEAILTAMLFAKSRGFNTKSLKSILTQADQDKAFKIILEEAVIENPKNHLGKRVSHRLDKEMFSGQKRSCRRLFSK